MSNSPLGLPFSAVVKPLKPLVYYCHHDTIITNAAVCPADAQSLVSLKVLQPFVAVLRLRYEGPALEGESEDEGDDESEAGRKLSAKGDKKERRDSDQDDGSADEGDVSDEDPDFSADDEDSVTFETKEVVLGCFTPNALQIRTEFICVAGCEYQFELSGSSDYEVHLIGRYPPSYPNTNSDGESESDLGSEFFSTDGQSSDDEDRIQEIECDTSIEANSKNLSNSKKDGARPTTSKNARVDIPKGQDSKKPTPKLLGGKTSDADVAMTDSDAATTQKSNKRPLEEKDLEAGCAGDSATDSTAKLSKAQRKKLKKSKAKLESGGPIPVDNEPKKAQSSKADPDEPKDDSKPAPPKTTTLPSGLKIVDVKAGKGIEAKAGQRVSMRYIGKLASGKVFDSNTQGKPFTFRLGGGEVIKGWDEGIKGMKVGGERKLIVPANLAYGKNGSPPDIPPNSNLTFEVKCLAIK